MKKCIYIIMALVIFALIIFFYIYPKNIKPKYKEDITLEYIESLNNSCNSIINSEDMALEYGELLLKNAFPEFFKYNDIKLGVLEINDKDYGKVWQVYEDTTDQKIEGGYVYVYFKKNGEVFHFDLAM